MEAFEHICEVCGKKETLTPEESYQKGWDYPPKMGEFGVLSPRTCGNCPIDKTVWWKIVQAEDSSAVELTIDEQKTVTRILEEVKIW